MRLTSNFPLVFIIFNLEIAVLILGELCLGEKFCLCVEHWFPLELRRHPYLTTIKR